MKVQLVCKLINLYLQTIWINVEYKTGGLYKQE
jgi:hypothetical protein